MNTCKNCKVNKVCDHDKYGFENCGNYIPNDVVPKSEVEAMQRTYGEILEVAEALITTLNKHKTELARQIFEEIEKIATAEGAYDYVSIQEITELKKKYTQECPKCKHFVGCEQANWERGCEEYEENSK